MTFEGTLLFALNAVGLAFVFLSHSDPPIATRSKLREPPQASVRTRARYPRVEPSGAIDAHLCAAIAFSWGRMGEMPDFNSMEPLG